MSEIIDYDIIVVRYNGDFMSDVNDKINEIIKEVKEKMSNGWQPIGGVVIDNSSRQLYQTIVKYKE